MLSSMDALQHFSGGKVSRYARVGVCFFPPLPELGYARGGIPSGGKLEYARVGVSQPFVVFFHLQSLSSRFLLGVRFGVFFQHVESGGPRIPSLRICFEIGHFASQHNVKKSFLCGRSSLSFEARTDRNI